MKKHMVIALTFILVSGCITTSEDNVAASPDNQKSICDELKSENTSLGLSDDELETIFIGTWSFNKNQGEHCSDKITFREDGSASAFGQCTSGGISWEDYEIYKWKIENTNLLLSGLSPGGGKPWNSKSPIIRVNISYESKVPWKLESAKKVDFTVCTEYSGERVYASDRYWDWRE